MQQGGVPLLLQKGEIDASVSDSRQATEDIQTNDPPPKNHSRRICYYSTVSKNKMREAAQFEHLEYFAGGAWGGDRLRGGAHWKGYANDNRCRNNMSGARGKGGCFL